MRSRPRLWTYGILPVVLNLLITAAVVTGLVAAVVLAVAWLHPLFPDGWGWRALQVLTALLLLLLALTLAFVAWVFLQGVLCGHYYGKLAEQVLREIGVPPAEIRSVPFTVRLADTCRDMFVLAGINLGLLSLHLVPVAGSILAVVGATYLNLTVLGGEFLEFSLRARGTSPAEIHTVTRQLHPHVLGLGTAVALLTLVPLAGLLLVTTAVTGAVLLDARRDAGQRGRGAEG